jgi:hypothetical protein
LRDIFGLCPSCQKKNFPEKLSKIVVDGGGGDYEKFRLDSIFPTKLTEFVPFIFIISQNCPIVKRILPDWLCLPNKLGGGGGGGGCRPRPVRPCPDGWMRVAHQLSKRAIPAFTKVVRSVVIGDCRFVYIQLLR